MIIYGIELSWIQVLDWTFRFWTLHEKLCERYPELSKLTKVCARNESMGSLKRHAAKVIPGFSLKSCLDHRWLRVGSRSRNVVDANARHWQQQIHQAHKDLLYYSAADMAALGATWCCSCSGDCQVESTAQLVWCQRTSPINSVRHCALLCLGRLCVYWVNSVSTACCSAGWGLIWFELFNIS